jgi:PAT family beta-lactamase induction signal transducer AmpG
MITQNWRTAFAVYLQPAVLSIVFLGFASGLPYVLVFSTLSAWLTEAGIERSVIGYFSWVGMTYSIKVFWSMIVDRMRLPLLTRLLGKRRSWMLLAQIGATLGLLGMSFSNPQTQLEQLALLAVWVAFCSATQDVAIDAYRIEVMSAEYQGAMAAAYVTGYRISLLTGAAGCLYIAEYSNWNIAYLTMAMAMSIGIITILLIKEPEHQANQDADALESKLESLLGVQKHATFWQKLVAGFSDVVLSPFVEFFNRNGKFGLLILLLIGLYKMSDITLGVMANPFYLDLGFSKTEIAEVTKLFSFVMAIAGATAGGVLVVKFGILQPLLFGSIATSLTNLLFAMLAMSKPTLVWLAVVVSTDSFCAGMATAAFIAYLSALTSTAYTATQYALFSSLMTLPAQMVGGFSGVIVENYGYALFFVYTTTAGLPAMILVLLLMRYQSQD